MITKHNTKHKKYNIKQSIKTKNKLKQATNNIKQKTYNNYIKHNMFPIVADHRPPRSIA